MSIPPQSCLVFSPYGPTCVFPLMYSFLILSILVTPNRNIFNSAISISCIFSNPYNIAGLTATLYTFPLSLADIRLSQLDHSWHYSSPIPSCLYSLLHFSSALSITWYSWAEVFEIMHSCHIFSLHFHCAVKAKMYEISSDRDHTPKTSHSTSLQYNHNIWHFA